MNDLPHLILTGPRVSDKLDFARSFLEKMFGPSSKKVRLLQSQYVISFQIKLEEKIYQTPSGKKLEISIFSSNFHIEVNPSELGRFDRLVIHEIIKDFAQGQGFGSSSPFKGGKLQ